MNAIERLRARTAPGWKGNHPDPHEQELDRAALAAVDALYQAAKEHLAHTAGYCVDRGPDGDATCRTHKSLAAAVRRVEGD